MRAPQMACVFGCFLAMGLAHAEGGFTTRQAEVMNQLLAGYAKSAKLGGASAFSATTGREFYRQPRTLHQQDYACSACHTDNPKQPGKHIETKKPIKPLAPAANPDRFTSAKKVEKSFSEHCFDLYDRDCRPEEKGNFIAFLMTVK